MKVMLQTPRNQVLLFSALLLTGAIFSGTVLVGGKGGKGTPASFTVTFSGDVVGGGCSGNRITERSNQIVINPVVLNLGFFFLPEQFLDGDVCFGSMSYPDVMAISEQKDGSILADFYFDAYTVTNEPIRYRLQMFGEVVVGGWLPDSGPSGTTIDLLGWEMGTDTKGPRKRACTGSGPTAPDTFDTTLTVVRVDNVPCD